MGGGDRIDLREAEPWYMRPTPRVPSQASNRCFLATRAPHDDELIGGPPARSLASFLVGLRFSSWPAACRTAVWRGVSRRGGASQ